MTEDEKVVENRIRRKAARRSFHLVKSPVRDEGAPDFGRYGLTMEYGPATEIGYYIKRQGKLRPSLTLSQIDWVLETGMGAVREICAGNAAGSRECLEKLISQGLPVSDEERILFGLEERP